MEAGEGERTGWRQGGGRGQDRGRGGEDRMEAGGGKDRMEARGEKTGWRHGGEDRMEAGGEGRVRHPARSRGWGCSWENV